MMRPRVPALPKLSDQSSGAVAASGLQETRRGVLRLLAAGLPAVSLAGCARTTAVQPNGSGVTSGHSWAKYDNAEQAGFDPAGIAAVERSLYDLPTTSLMIVRGGKLVYSYGDIGEVSYLASARKSVLSMLYGNYVAKGMIDLDRTLGDLGITDKGGLLPIEKTARVRDLLISSSGVYHPAGSPGGEEKTPPRGSKVPGTYFHYNNWDFNVLGTIFEQLTGKTVFAAFAQDLAAPLQMQDFDPSRQRMLGYKTEPSIHLAYHFFLSGRDMAKLGQLMLNNGLWNGRQLVPQDWVKESTALHVPLSAMADGGEAGYAYLWWKPSESRRGPEWRDSYLANGHFGQFILVMPAMDTVVVHRRAIPDELAIARNLGYTEAQIPRVSVSQFLKVVDGIVLARRD